MANITVKRTSSDTVELRSGNDSSYLEVSRKPQENAEDIWQVTKTYDFVVGGDIIHKCGTAQEAVEFAKEWLNKGKSELDEALK